MGTGWGGDRSCVTQWGYKRQKKLRGREWGWKLWGRLGIDVFLSPCSPLMATVECCPHEMPYIENVHIWNVKCAVYIAQPLAQKVHIWCEKSCCHFGLIKRPCKAKIWIVYLIVTAGRVAFVTAIGTAVFLLILSGRYSQCVEVMRQVRCLCQGSESEGTRQSDATERQRLAQLLQLQTREINALKEEILMLSRKGGNVVPPSQPPLPRFNSRGSVAASAPQPPYSSS